MGLLPLEPWYNFNISANSQHNIHTLLPSQSRTASVCQDSSSPCLPFVPISGQHPQVSAERPPAFLYELISSPGTQQGGKSTITETIPRATHLL